MTSTTANMQKVRRQRAGNVHPALWLGLLAIFLSETLPAAVPATAPTVRPTVGPTITGVIPEPEGSVALQTGSPNGVLESTEPLVQFGHSMAGTQATWLVPAEYSRTINGVDVLQVRPDIFMLTIEGENVAVQTGWQGTLVIDAGAGRNCEGLVAAVNAVVQTPIRYIVNTSSDADRMGCNSQLARAGRGFAESPGGGAPIIGHQNIMQHLLFGSQDRPTVELPTEVFTRFVRSMYVNNQAIQLFWMPAAHTDADIMVTFRRSDVVVTGNILDLTRFPVINLARGGSINGEIAALNRLLEEFAVAVTPKWQRPGGTLVIPGRGRLAQHTDVLNYRDMVTIVRNRVQALIDEGASLEDVQKSNPARGYETRYGAQSGSWTTDNFIAAVYESLLAERRGAAQ